MCTCILTAELRVVSQSFRSHVRLQSALSRTYLCFNRRGRLIVKVSINSTHCRHTRLYTCAEMSLVGKRVNVQLM